jgi:hypothetical protein
MHILFTVREREAIDSMVLPNGTTLIEQSIKGKPLRRWRVKNSKMVVEEDFVENARPWKKGEADVFVKGVDRERVVDYFLSKREGDSIPQREYSTMSNLEYDLLKFVKHDGCYETDKKTSKQRNLFRISLNRDSDIKAAQEEVSWLLTKIVKAYPDWQPIHLGVFEHTLSQYGIYSLDWDGKKSFVLNKCTYGRVEKLKEFNDLYSTLEYIAKNHYYE